jgi:pyruvate dehydrogenase E2 component (dihydrolipoamide acetyltransferase)
MAIPVIMPRQGQSVETCIITQWTKKKGDPVKAGDILFSYETDKASFDTEAQDDGVLLEIFFNDGDEVPVLTNVAVIGKTGEDAESFRPGSSISAAAAASSTAAPSAANATDASPSVSPDQRLRISPRAKAMAVKLGVNPGTVTGTGPNGRIVVRDIETAPAAATTTAASHTTDAALAISPAGLAYEEKKLSNIRKIIAKAMHESISVSAQLTHHLSADVRKLLVLRAKVKSDIDKGSTLNITINDMVCFAVIKALEKFPEVNSHFLGESTRTFKKIHLGLAVDTPRGLMVPAIQNADDLSLKGLSARLREVAEQCRKGNVNPELLSATAASFTALKYLPPSSTCHRLRYLELIPFYTGRLTWVTESLVLYP